MNSYRIPPGTNSRRAGDFPQLSCSIRVQISRVPIHPEHVLEAIGEAQARV